MIVDYHRLMYWMQENAMDPAALKRELDLENDTFGKMRKGQDSDEAVVAKICQRLGCSMEDIRYKR